MKSNTSLRKGLGLAALVWGAATSTAVQGCGPEKETIVEKHFYNGGDTGNGSYTVEDACEAMGQCYDGGFIPDGNGWYEGATVDKCVKDTNKIIEYAKEKGYMQCVNDAINCWGFDPYPDNCDCYKLEQIPSCEEALDNANNDASKVIIVHPFTGPLSLVH